MTLQKIQVDFSTAKFYRVVKHYSPDSYEKEVKFIYVDDSVVVKFTENGLILPDRIRNHTREYYLEKETRKGLKLKEVTFGKYIKHLAKSDILNAWLEHIKKGDNTIFYSIPNKKCIQFFPKDQKAHYDF